QIGTLLFRCGDGISTRGNGTGDLAAKPGQAAPDLFGDQGLVLDHEDTQAFDGFRVRRHARAIGTVRRASVPRRRGSSSNRPSTWRARDRIQGKTGVIACYVPESSESPAPSSVPLRTQAPPPFEWRLSGMAPDCPPENACFSALVMIPLKTRPHGTGRSRAMV